MTYWPVVFLAGFQLAFLVSYASVIYHYQSAQTKHKLFVSRFCRPRYQNVIVGHKVHFDVPTIVGDACLSRRFSISGFSHSHGALGAR
jgi:hypothetical protein